MRGLEGGAAVPGTESFLKWRSTSSYDVMICIHHPETFFLQVVFFSSSQRPLREGGPPHVA
jgi:hypothetical protein